MTFSEHEVESAIRQAFQGRTFGGQPVDAEGWAMMALKNPYGKDPVEFASDWIRQGFSSPPPWMNHAFDLYQRHYANKKE